MQLMNELQTKKLLEAQQIAQYNWPFFNGSGYRSYISFLDN